MLIPGRIYQYSTVRIPVNFQDAAGADVDPDTIKFKLYAPDATITTYTYNTDAQLLRTSTGDYYVDVTPSLPGRWHFRWESTGTNKASAIEGSFVVQVSRFFEPASSDAYRS
jgi:hypothetical protein